MYKEKSNCTHFGLHTCTVDQGRTQRGAAGAVAPPKKIKLAIFILLQIYRAG